MKKLAILGAGGHGAVVADAAEASGWQKIHFFDQRWPENTQNAVWDIVGDLTALKKTMRQYDGFIIAIGHNKTRLNLMTELNSIHPPWVNIIHPRAVISPYAELGLGSVVFAGVVVNAMTKIGRGVILNTGATLDHDCIIEEAVHICPGSHIAGQVRIGALSWLGIGSTVKQCLTIGSEVMVGAGSVVIQDIPNNQLAYGVPARIQGEWHA
jgi:sugar O-acyltransferase (sialic acid O-acetyltransferase NeuD family)